MLHVVQQLRCSPRTNTVSASLPNPDAASTAIQLCSVDQGALVSWHSGIIVGRDPVAGTEIDGETAA